MTDVRTRVDTVPLVAGVAVLDLVNTVSWRGDPERGEDHLRGADECLRWARRADVITADELERLRRRLQGSPPRRARLVAGLLDLRELVATTVGTDAEVLPRDVSATIAEAYAHADLIRTAGAPAQAGGRGWQIRTLDEDTVRRRLTLQLAALLTGTDGRIGSCGDPDCGWVFLDTSRARNRRWCSSADCGNRYRVREHQRRRSR